jgi:hypothetical protein
MSGFGFGGASMHGGSLFCLGLHRCGPKPANFPTRLPDGDARVPDWSGRNGTLGLAGRPVQKTGGIFRGISRGAV